MQVHDMLVKVATSLVAGGESGIFTPMHLLVFRKPEADAGAAGAAKKTTNGAAKAASKAAK